MKRQILGVSTFFVAVAFLLQAGFPQTASAASGPCFFPAGAGGLVLTGGTCAESGSGAYGINDVLSGRNNKGYGLAVPSCVNTKAELIAFILSRWNYNDSNCASDQGDYTRDKIGSAFLMQELRGAGNAWPTAASVSDWVARMNLSSVSVSRGGQTVGNTSYYDNDEKNVFYGAHAAVPRDIVEISVNGNPIAKIEAECGNLVAGSRNLPSLPPPPTATIAATAWVSDSTIRPGETARFVNQVTVSNISGNVAGDTFTTGVASSSTWDTGWLGSWPVDTAVSPEGARMGSDIDGDGDRDGYRTTFTAGASDVGRLVCRYTRVSSGGSSWYANTTGDNVSACTRVIGTSIVADVGSGTPLPDFEKGDPSIVSTNSVSAKICDASGNDHTVTWETSTETGDGGVSSGSFTVPDCSTSYTVVDVGGFTITNTSLNAQVPGYEYKRKIEAKYGSTIASDPDSGIVYSLPYTTFTGNDIEACGANLGSTNISGRIIFNIKDDNTTGSAVDYAALAFTGFNTSSKYITTAKAGIAAPSDRLKTNLASNTKSPCGLDVSSYYLAPSPATNTTISNNIAGYYESNSPLTFSSGQTDKKITIRTVGASSHVYITGNNIGVNPGSVPTGAFNDASAPVVLIISGGDIYIDPSVTVVNAILIANGTINTCYSSPGIPSTANLEQAPPVGCFNRLTINGAIKAANINFRRSIGARLLPNSPANPPAEQINYPGYLNFASPYLRDTSESTFQSLFNAPPYL